MKKIILGLAIISMNIVACNNEDEKRFMCVIYPVNDDPNSDNWEAEKICFDMSMYDSSHVQMFMNAMPQRNALMIRADNCEQCDVIAKKHHQNDNNLYY